MFLILIIMANLIMHNISGKGNVTMLRFFKSPLGIAITAVSAILVASPEARKTVRKWAVKGTASVLDLIDQAKDSGRHQIEEARVEQRKAAGLPEESNFLPDHRDVPDEKMAIKK